MSKKKTVKVRLFRELSALKGLIREKGTSYREVARYINIATPTFSNKINGYACFDAVEIDKMCDFLDIHEKDAWRYFFPHRCSNYTRSA